MPSLITVLKRFHCQRIVSENLRGMVLGPHVPLASGRTHTHMTTQLGSKNVTHDFAHLGDDNLSTLRLYFTIIFFFFAHAITMNGWRNRRRRMMNESASLSVIHSCDPAWLIDVANNFLFKEIYMFPGQWLDRQLCHLSD